MISTSAESSPCRDLIRLQHISKSFGGQLALKDISWNLQSGEIHCLAGTNGSGKSTLIKIICGVYEPDSGGEIIIDGVRYPQLTPSQSRKLGIQVIYQDLSLFPNLTVAENIAFELNLQGMLHWHNAKKLKAMAQSILDELKFHIDLDTKVEHLPIAQRQQIAICRALIADARLVIMDEPTASLTRTEVNQLIRTIHYLKQKGISVVFVSHRLDEVLEISERVTVLRDSIHVGTYPAAEVTPKRLAELMTGVAIEHHAKSDNTATEQVILETRDLCRQQQYTDISFKLHEGEILGLCGLLGSGRTELALSLFGITSPDKGQILINQQPVTFKEHVDAIRAGIGYVSEDRLSLGLILPQSIADNMVISVMDRLQNCCGLIDENKKSQLVKKWIADLDVKTTNPQNAIATLSGGNQQKVVLAKWMSTNPKILILDSPTVGVDIGAKDSIYKLIHKLAANKIAILLISDEIPEVYYNCDRILHFDHGKILNEYRPRDISETQLAKVING